MNEQAEAGPERLGGQGREGALARVRAEGAAAVERIVLRPRKGDLGSAEVSLAWVLEG